jgi:hypothetical protein
LEGSSLSPFCINIYLVCPIEEAEIFYEKTIVSQEEKCIGDRERNIER